MRPRRRALALLCLLTASTWLSAQVTVRPDSFYSPALQRTMNYTVILPERYDLSRSYPVLFLLHGAFGDYRDWTARTKLVEYCASCSLIVILPDAENSWYVNSWNDPKARFEDYLTEDLREEVFGKYAADTSRCALAGLSMGGYGAVKIALRFPGRYFFAGGLSSALSVVDSGLSRMDRGRNPALQASIDAAFGGAPQTSLDEQNTLLLARRASGPSAPYIYLATGIQDGFRSLLPANRALAESLRVNAIPYEYHEVPGAHTWILWNREIQPLLHRLMDLAPRVR